MRYNARLVVERAGDLADKEGLTSVTLTRLAEVLGIRPPSLFNHVDSLQDLYLKIAVDGQSLLLSQVELAHRSVASPVEMLHLLLGVYRNFVHEHPGRYSAILRIPAKIAHVTPELTGLDTRLFNLMADLAQSLGWPQEETVHAARAWRSLVHGFSDLEVNGGFGYKVDIDESFHRAVEALARPLLRS